MTERVQHIIDFFKDNVEEIPAFGIYDSRNTVGDRMFTIYDKENVQIDACYDYGYIEIFGLTPEEFTSCCVEIDKLTPNEEDDDNYFNTILK